jgi:hypothetical protein
MLSMKNKKVRKTCENTSAMPAIYDQTVNLQCESAHNTMRSQINTKVEKNCFSLHSRLLTAAAVYFRR